MKLGHEGSIAFCDLGSWLKPLKADREFCTFLAVCRGKLRLAKYLEGAKFELIAEARA